MHAFISGAKPPQKKEVPQTLKHKTLPWVEKYRPKSVDQIAYQSEVVAVLQKCTEGLDLPNLLFYGPPGTGKTSAILAVARQIFGPDFAERVLELNASDERGIQVVRDKVKSFARQTATAKRRDGRPCPPLKLIILDEADNMTSAAQVPPPPLCAPERVGAFRAALRRTMEKESRTTRFCLICNYISRIIDPLTSRCTKFRFKPLSDAAQKQRLAEIAATESVAVTDEALDALIDACEGDLRKSITYLQSAARIGPSVDVRLIVELTAVVPADWIDRLVAACRSGKFELVELAVAAVQREGYSAYQILLQLQEVVINEAELKDLQKAAICDRMGLCEKRLLDGADEFLQLMDLGCVMTKHYKTLA